MFTYTLEIEQRAAKDSFAIIREMSDSKTDRWAKISKLAQPGPLIISWFIIVILCAIVYWQQKIDANVFLSILLAALLSHISAAIIARAAEIGQIARENENDRLEHERALFFLSWEASQNNELAKNLRAFLYGLDSMTPMDFANRAHDYLMSDFSLLGRETWQKIFLGPLSIDSLKLVEEVYIKYEYANRLLVSVRSSLAKDTNYPEFKSYKNSVRTNLWYNQLQNVLAKIETDGPKATHLILTTLKL